MNLTRHERQKVIQRKKKELTTLEGYVDRFTGDPRNPSEAVDIDATLWKYKKYFPTHEEFMQLYEDVLDMVYAAADNAGSYRMFAEHRRALDYNLLDKVKAECESRKLRRKERVSQKIKYEIAQAVGMTVPVPQKFGKGNPSYHRISACLSELGYVEPTPKRK